MICTLTINPAIDRILYIKEFTPNFTNRVKQVMDVLGGKGTHVSVNLSLLKCKNKAFGISLGQNGRRIEEMLSNDFVDTQFLHFEGSESRMNYAVIEENTSCTLITEKGQMVSNEICRQLIAHIVDNVSEGDYFVLSGDASNTEMPHIYNEIMDALSHKNIKFFLDTSSDSLIEGIKRKPFLIKPNEDELSQLLGREFHTEQEILSGMWELAEQGIPCIALTCGKNGSYIWYQNEIYRIYPLKLNVINTIGCGDAFLSGMLYGFDTGLDFKTTLKYAAAVSSATAESNSTVGFDPDRVTELLDKVTIETISSKR